MSRSAAEEVLRDIENEAKGEYLPIIGKDAGAELERLVRERNPRLAVEIGVMTGYATIRIGRSLGEGARLVGFEISEELARRARVNVDRAGLAPSCDVRREDAHSGIPAIEGEVDFAFMDAERGQYLTYLRKLEPKLAPGAMVIAAGADVPSDRMQKYFDHVRLSGKYESRHLAFDNGAFEVSLYRG